MSVRQRARRRNTTNLISTRRLTAPTIHRVKVGKHARELVRERILRLCTAGLDSRTLQTEVMAALRRAVPCEAWCIGTIDPATLMLTGSIGEGYPMKGSGRFLEIEYGEPGPNKYAELARRTPPVGTLVHATGGDLETSTYWRDICRPAGLRDELRAALVVDGACWGRLRSHERQVLRTSASTRPSTSQRSAHRWPSDSERRWSWITRRSRTARSDRG